MRFPLWCVLLGLLAAAPVARPGQAPPKVLLHIPFDGTLDAAFAANGRLKLPYIHAAYRPGTRAQAAELGSDRFPSGLLIGCAGVFDKARGSLEFWYMPLWNPADPVQQAVPRVLVTDEKAAGEVGHFWVAIDRGTLHVALQGRQLEGVSAPIHRWRPETWHHVVVAWDCERGMQLYLDGELEAQRALRWVLPPSELLYLGANRYGADRAEGLFDELRLYDRALTATDVELALIRKLTSQKAPVVPLSPKPRREPGKHDEPRLSFHLTFDNIVEAQTAMGDARPLVAEGAKFAKGLVGQAVVADASLRLYYHFEKNLSKEAGTVSLWARSLPEGAGWRGVLLTDDLETEGPDRHGLGSLALWTQRIGVPYAHFAMWPLLFTERLARWDEEDWYHVAATWRLGEEITLYVNGREVGRRKEGGALWGTEAPKLFYVGSAKGRVPAKALIDDVRFYNGPLSEEEVRKQASQFLLPFVFQLGRTVYEQGQPGELVGRFFNLLSEDLATKITVRVASPEKKNVATTTASVEAPRRGWAQVRVPLSGEVLATPGLYEVTTSSAERTAGPRAHFLVVAPEPKQAATQGEGEPKPKLEDVKIIECTRHVGPEVSCDSGGARIVKSKLGGYREAGDYPDARFAYQFAVTQVDVPHVAVVTYPADGARSAEILMTSRRHPESGDVATGYFVDEEDAAQPRMVELPIYFWPREKENAIIFRTLEAGRPAACAQIAIRQVAGGLPVASVALPPDGGRAVGSYWHEPVVPMRFGAREFAASDVYESFRRLTDYLRFTGQNLLCYPVAWRHGVLYPCEAEDFRLGAGADAHASDWIEQVLYLCERRGIRFLPEMFFGDTFALSGAYAFDTDEMVAAGSETARMVTWDGTLARGGPGELPRYNPLHPDVRTALLDRITEVVGRYSKFPALDGLSLHLGPGQSAWFGSIQCGYDDRTVADFVKAVDIEMPAFKKGPARFAERARWLFSNRYEEWVAWRCRELRGLYTELASRLKSTRPDLKLYLTVGSPEPTSWHPLLSLRSWDSSPRSLGRLYREAGLDLALYTKRPENLYVRKVAFATDERYLRYRFGSGGPSPHPVLARDIAFLSEGNAPFLGFPRSGAVCSYPYFDSAVGAARPMRGFWWKSPQIRSSHPVPVGRKALEPLAHAVAELDVTSLAVGGGGLVPMGHEDELREFVRAFRALPNQPFTDIKGLSDPVCGRELRAGLNYYFYLVNRAGFPVDVHVALKGEGVAVHDFAADKEVALRQVQDAELPGALPEEFVSEHSLPDEEGRVPEEKATQRVTGSVLQVRLEPFQLRSYRVVTKGTEIVYAGSQAPSDRRFRLAQRLDSARSLVEHSKADAEVLTAARATLDLVGRAWRKHELSRVEYLLDSYPLARLR